MDDETEKNGLRKSSCEVDEQAGCTCHDVNFFNMCKSDTKQEPRNFMMIACIK